MDDCLFCKIVNREIPSEITYQDDQITVFKNAGGAHLDLMVAAALVKRLQERRK